MAETSLIQLSQLSKLSKDQMKFLDKQFKREHSRYVTGETLGFIKAMALNPVVLLIGGYVTIDYLEAHDWPGREGDTMLGPVSANALRGAIAAGVVMDALGKSGIADALGEVARAGGSAVTTALPLLAGATAVPGVPPPP